MEVTAREREREWEREREQKKRERTTARECKKKKNSLSKFDFIIIPLLSFWGLKGEKRKNSFESSVEGICFAQKREDKRSGEKRRKRLSFSLDHQRRRSTLSFSSSKKEKNSTSKQKMADVDGTLGDALIPAINKLHDVFSSVSRIGGGRKREKKKW